jgi:[acyl-carrier-protein] S-malonyltransferase
MRVGFIFPGQGSQIVGMGRDLAESFPIARETFTEADETLDFSLSKLCWQGPEADLQLTANTQPALLATSVAALRVIQETGIEPVAVAGHSLGEYSALVAAGALGFADALKLVRRRGEAMQEAVPVGQGSMAAILSLDAEDVQAAVEEAAGNEVCSIANYNAPGQIVIAGHTGAVERAVQLCQAKGARRAVLLPVSAPFHCSLMAPARESLTPMLTTTEFADPAIPVVCNIDARPVMEGDSARDAVRRQIDGPVRWSESMEWMAGEGGVEMFIEVGPGKVLTGLNRRIARQIKTIGMGGPEDLDRLQERTKETA